MRGSLQARGVTYESMGNKSVSDMVGDNIRMAWSGDDCKITGEVKGLYLPEFDSTHQEQQTGHYFPYVFDESYKGKPVTYKNRKDGDRKGTVDAEDATVILRAGELQRQQGGD